MLLVVLAQLLLSPCVGDGDKAVWADGVEASILVLAVEERAPSGGMVMAEDQIQGIGCMRLAQVVSRK
jgi:hypothetical protein